jgi:predicted phosphodiesterase
MKIGVITDTHWRYSNLNDELVKQKILELKENNIEVLIHSGDIGSHDPIHTKQFCVVLRNIFPTIPIGMVNGNHSYWCVEDNFTHVQDIEKYYIDIFNELDIIYLQSEAMEFETEKGIVHVSGFNGWYSSDPSTNDRYRIPNYYVPGEGRDWLKDQETIGFTQAMANCTEAKSRGATTVLVTHFGFTEDMKDKDWKAIESRMMNFGIHEYFGANLVYENYLDCVDYLVVGHSHQEYTGVAKNGNTQVINAGGDYELPKFRILEI